MKKILFIFLLIFAFGFYNCYAQSEITYFETVDFAHKEKTIDGTWTDWSDWEESNLIVCCSTQINFFYKQFLLFRKEDMEKYKKIIN